MDTLIGALITAYLLFIPFFANQAWQGNELSFTRWYFKKSDSVNWLGFSIFLIIGSGSFLYVLLYYIGVLLLYIIVLPLYWLFEFMFLNKDCTHIVCDDLNRNKRGR